jgi:hypothetical protein
VIRRASSAAATKKKEDYIYTEQLREDVHELDQHHNFKERFLGREGAFGEFRILIGYFSPMQYCGGFEATAGQELKKRGFNYTLV